MTSSLGGSLRQSALTPTQLYAVQQQTCPAGSSPEMCTSSVTCIHTSQYEYFYLQMTNSSSSVGSRPFMSPQCGIGILQRNRHKTQTDRPSLGPSPIRRQASPLPTSRRLPLELDLVRLARRELELPEHRADSPTLPPTPEESLDLILEPPRDIVLYVSHVQYRAYLQDVLLADLNIPAAIASIAASSASSSGLTTQTDPLTEGAIRILRWHENNASISSAVCDRDKSSASSSPTVPDNTSSSLL